MTSSIQLYQFCAGRSPRRGSAGAPAPFATSSAVQRRFMDFTSGPKAARFRNVGKYVAMRACALNNMNKETRTSHQAKKYFLSMLWGDL